MRAVCNQHAKQNMGLCVLLKSFCHYPPSTIGELREEVKELRDRVDKVQKEPDACKRDFYELTEKYLGIVRD